MEKVNYSIIIPHHNIPRLLERCLFSIPKRDDLQVIVVDDYSDDEAQATLRGMEKDFPHVLFVYSSGPREDGSGRARNIGLSRAVGRFVLFADADDYFNYCFRHVLDEYASADYDAVYFNASSVGCDTYCNAYRSLRLNRLIKMYDKRPDKAVFYLKYCFGEPWCKMVKRSIIEENNIKFDETFFHNDTRFSYLVGYYSQDIHVDKRAIYCVTDRINSTIKNVSTDNILVEMKIVDEANTFYKSHDIDYFDYSVAERICSYLLKWQIKNAKRCIQVYESSGMKKISILLLMFRFPFYLFRNSWKVKFKIHTLTGA